VRYAVFHLDEYSREAKTDLMERLDAFSDRVAFLVRDGSTWLAEIAPEPAVPISP
jgi:hypothetical protein